MGLTQSAEDEEVVCQVLVGGIFGRDDERPIDECACCNEDGTFNVSQYEACLDRESDEISSKMRVVYYLLLQLFTEAKAKAAMDLRAATGEEPPTKKCEFDKSKHSLTHLLGS
jgi:hypothetical protein